ncbi:uncharacterized protein DUF2648 [Prosthecobacter fusiformis]|uniref:Uncharacterized protein DUF2648 n=1 Tax=Prosthecobacter fusiformis TaxID=48464 RepID=A0A4R7RZN0_9BACT|nr:TrbI/VirB10 family protein [Prosthecobacter fusiformis]TDU71440.1 uncharacterized protein DUF2648 [Prosthecobacter fusiformis]
MTKYLQKTGVQMGLLAVVLAIAGVAFYMTKRQPPPVNAAPVSAGPQAQMALEDKTVSLTGKRTASVGTGQQVEKFVVPPKKPQAPSLISTGSSSTKKQQKAPPFPKLVHISNSKVAPYVPKDPELFAPRGLLIKAALVITVDSSDLSTPVLALVTEDVYWNGRLIVPAGTQVQAQAGQGRSRDRIEVKGGFTFVWADGREYNISGVALDHERLPDGTFGITDGSAGIRGQIVKNDQYAELKILVAEALQGIMNNKQDQFQSIYGLVPENSSRNSALGGGSQAASAYSGLLTKKLEKDLDFVRVSAGTQFYIYTLDVFEPNLASIAGLKQGNKPTSSWQLAEEAYARAQTETAVLTETTGKVTEANRKAEEQARTAERAARISSLINRTSEDDDSAESTPSSSTTP